MVYCKQEDLVLSHLFMVKNLAKICRRQYSPFAELNELISAGTIGLIEASRKFDMKRDCSFKTYATYRIRGAIIDEIRSKDWVSSWMRREGSHYQIVSTEDDLQFSAREKALISGVTYQQSENKIFDLELKKGLSSILRDPEKIDRKGAELIRLYYYKNIDFDCIAKRFKVTQGRVSQIHKASIERLRKLPELVSLLNDLRSDGER